jgi:hypothetical protein
VFSATWRILSRSFSVEGSEKSLSASGQTGKNRISRNYCTAFAIESVPIKAVFYTILLEGGDGIYPSLHNQHFIFLFTFYTLSTMKYTVHLIVHYSIIALFKGTQECEFFGFDFEFCTISMLVMHCKSRPSCS